MEQGLLGLNFNGSSITDALAAILDGEIDVIAP